MNDKIRIPIPLQIVMDDFGWHEGKNSLKDGGPARTGMLRPHEVEDIRIVNEVGKRLNMKIVCGFTIGEWDKDNVLRGMKHATKYGDAWDRRCFMDMDKANAMYNAIEGSDNIELAFHGLMHGYWIDGENYGNPREFFIYDLPEGAAERRLDYPVKPVLAEYVKSHVEAFFKIYNSWGFTKKIRTFISPASLYKDEALAIEYAKEIEKFGILYWKNGWNEFEGTACMLKSIVFLKAYSDLVDWCAYDIDHSTLEDYVYGDTYPNGYAVIGMHWANFLRSDPESNMEYVDAWVNYFKRQEEIFGYMLSTDIAFAASQALYHEKLTLEFNENKCVIDTSKVKSLGAKQLAEEFYISVDSALGAPKNIFGAQISVYKVHSGFTVYKLIPNDTLITLEF